MRSISEIWRTRLIVIGLVLLSLAPVVLQQMLTQSNIYEMRLVGGVHPSDVLMLRHIGQFSIVCPAIFVCVLIISAIRPTLTRLLLTISVAAFLIYLVLFLFQTVNVIQLRVSI
jgi:hypothetical protein